MKKLFDREPIWFAVIWILAYVVGFSLSDELSEALGMPKLVTVAVGLVLSLVLVLFLRRHDLLGHVGLCPVAGSGGEYLWFLPLVVLSTVNFWNGVEPQAAPVEMALYMISMVLVGFLEEVIFRGLLFPAMEPDGKRTAIVVSSLTFGVGHIVNLLLGAPLFETLLQLVYASAIGFCFTAVFIRSGSIWPCILAHAVTNATSILAREPSQGQRIFSAAALTILSIIYGFWLLQKTEEETTWTQKCRH